MGSCVWIKWLLCIALAISAGACADTLTDTSSVDFVDHDGDGYDDSTADCDPSLASVNIKVDSWLDNDGDGYGSPQTLTKACPGAAGYVTNGSDCNDVDKSTHPGAAEVCDGIDQNCNDRIDDDAVDALTYYADADGDTFGDREVSTRACTAPAGYVQDWSDCDDADKLVYPGTTEMCNGKDDDCDQAVDEADAADAGTWYVDGDSDGHGDGKESSRACTAPSGTVSSADDCDDAAASIYPGAPEVCDGKDQDCDEQIDEGVTQTFYRDGDGDGYGVAGDTVIGCSAPGGYASSSGDCDDTDGKVNPGATEICDGKDDDCSGSTPANEADGDKDGYRGCEGDCNDTNASIHPGAKEVCNNADDDCDGYTDEGFEHYNYYADVDGDGFGSEDAIVWNSCVAPRSGYTARRGDCNDGDKSIFPGAEDKSGDTVDSDCGGSADKDPSVGLKTSQFSHIQDAINAAVDKATVWVGPGTYSEANIQFGAKDIKLRSTDFAGKTIVNGSGDGSVFALDSIAHGNSNRYKDSVLDGLMITGGYTGMFFGGGLNLSSSDISVENCSISGNQGSAYGGGVYAESSSVKFRNCNIIQNTLAASSTVGGGLYISGFENDVLIDHCTILNNYAKNAACLAAYSVNLSIVNCVMNGNASLSGSGGEIYLVSSTVVLRNSVVDGSSDKASSIYVDAQSELSLIGSVLTHGAAYGVYFAQGTNDNQGSATITYSDIYSASGQNFYPASPANLTLGDGVLMVAPQFISATDYHLALGSPLVNAGDPTILDPDGTRSDMGIYGGPDGGQWDLDGDLYPDYFWPGSLCDRPKGASSAAFGYAFDANDQDANTHSAACP